MTTKQLLDLVYARLVRSLTLSHADIERMGAVLDEIEREHHEEFLKLANLRREFEARAGEGHDE